MPSMWWLGCNRGHNLWFVAVCQCPRAWPVGSLQPKSPSGLCGWWFPMAGPELSKMLRSAQRVRDEGTQVEFRPSRSLWYVKATCVCLCSVHKGLGPSFIEMVFHEVCAMREISVNEKDRKKS